MATADPLTPAQIDAYLRDGVLVVDDVLSRDDLAAARRGLARTLLDDCGVDVYDLERTGRNLAGVSSTRGAGGVLDVFYPDWKMRIATDERLFRMTRQLWREAHCHAGEGLEELTSASGLGEDASAASGVEEDGAARDGDVSFKWHPFGPFDVDKGYMYIDRIGYRIPTKLAERIGKQLASEETARPTTHGSSAPTASDARKPTPRRKKKKKPRPIQRSLTPHFDCCPERYDDASTKSKWRPIQCLVSLTDNLHPGTGGFEAVPGFHREFRRWAANGRRLVGEGGDGGLPARDGDGEAEDSPPGRPRPCVGEYAHLDPTLDRGLLRRVRHVPVRAGSAVFWDNRIPHANSYRNDPPPAAADDDDDGGGGSDGDGAAAASSRGDDALGPSGSRAVVYCSFLPDVEVNRRFVRTQLEDWRAGRAPRVGDRWIELKEGHGGGDGGTTGDSAGADESIGGRTEGMTELGKRLIGLLDWT